MKSRREGLPVEFMVSPVLNIGPIGPIGPMIWLPLPLKPTIILVLELVAMRSVQLTPERLILFEGAIK